MLICPVCRSQNMDSAKFCGNCGNPFSKDSEPTSSLINCPQGHIYSAVYQHCPYCPQPQNDDALTFATRIEEPVTSVESIPVSEGVEARGQVDVVTRFESDEPPPRQDFMTTSTEMHSPTEVISVFQGMGQPAEAGSPASGKAAEPPQPPAATVVTPPAPFSEEPRSGQHSVPEIDRRTMIVPDHMAQGRSSKGKIVGWLITFSKNPDGVDFRVYSGYNRLGANPVCDIVIDDETVSGSHAIIVYRDGKCLIKDDLSRNGTFVNGREITEAHQLQNYDQVRVGNTTLTYVSVQRGS